MADNVHGSFCKWYPPIMGGADNVQLDKNTTTGAIIAADAVVVGTTTQYHQRVKLSIGTSGSASDVHSGNPLPVTIPGSVSVTGGPIIVHVSGVVSVSPSGAFYIITPTGTSLPVRVSGTVAIAEPITISGTVIARVSGSVTLVEPITISGSVAVSGTRADRGAFTKGTSKII